MDNGLPLFFINGLTLFRNTKTASEFQIFHILSGVGRLVFGKVADLPNINRILLQQISFVAIGLCTMLLTAAPKFTGFEWESMVIFALIMGKHFLISMDFFKTHSG